MKYIYVRSSTKLTQTALIHLPSGPRLLPVPKVNVAPRALRENRMKSLRSGRGFRFFVHVMRYSGGEALVNLTASKSTKHGTET